mmetsp:Transcript_11409/g.29898  ORF Transcript_11409/g.29898 Transcript_11409/m.29898 type:complete len:83 (+) Transcript_11409:991-1239(+)
MSFPYAILKRSALPPCAQDGEGELRIFEWAEVLEPRRVGTVGEGSYTVGLLFLSKAFGFLSTSRALASAFKKKCATRLARWR